MVPTLPPPVLDMVLAQDVLSNADLARCALASSTLLDGARRSLYYEVRLEVSESPDKKRSGMLGDNDPLVTLLAHPLAAQAVRRVTVVKVAGWSEAAAAGGLSATMALAQVLGLCRGVRQVDLENAPSCTNFTDVLLACGLSLTHLYVNRGTPYWFPLLYMRHVQHLVIDVRRGRFPETLTLPYPVKSLGIRARSMTEDELAFLIPAFFSRYQSAIVRLHIPAALLALDEFSLSSFPNLAHLCIRDLPEASPRHAQALLQAISPLQNLETIAFLSISYASPSYRNLRQTELPSSLPPSRCLVLGSAFSATEVINFLTARAGQGLRHLRWYPPAPPEDHEAQMFDIATVRSVCEVAGVAFTVGAQGGGVVRLCSLRRLDLFPDASSGSPPRMRSTSSATRFIVCSWSLRFRVEVGQLEAAERGFATVMCFSLARHEPVKANHIAEMRNCALAKPASKEG
ncbi:hypothetical protein JCM10213_005511 [Rhodosporidiobolus nylandii]